jgi:hypothetical protein
MMHWQTGRRFKYVTLRPRKPGFLAYVYPYNLGRQRRLRTEQDCLNEMMRSTAGYAAEHYYLYRKPQQFQQLEAWLSSRFDGFGDHDVARFLELGQMLDEHFRSEILPGQKGLRSWAAIWHDTEVRVAELWPAVESIAAELDERRTLSGQDVFDLASAAIPPSRE